MLLGVGAGVGVSVGAGVAALVGMAIGVFVDTDVDVPVGAGVGASVSAGVGVLVGMAVDVLAGSGNGVSVGEGVCVGSSVFVGGKSVFRGNGVLASSDASAFVGDSGGVFVSDAASAAERLLALSAQAMPPSASAQHNIAVIIAIFGEKRHIRIWNLAFTSVLFSFLCKQHNGIPAYFTRTDTIRRIASAHPNAPFIHVLVCLW